MIGRLRGTLVQKQAPVLLLDVNGIGYEIEATMTTFYELPAAGAQVTLYTHLVVREDAQLLYGFANEAERALFRDLIKINGVGAKLALTILSGMSVDSFVHCVREKDAASLTRLPGVGKKTAERLIIEMKDRLESNAGITIAGGTNVVGLGAVATNIASPVGDAVSALIALGYKPQEASKMVRSVDVDGMDSEEIIRNALQTMVK